MPTIPAAKARDVAWIWRVALFGRRLLGAAIVIVGLLACVSVSVSAQGITPDDPAESAAAKSQHQGMTPGTIVQPIRPAPPVVAARTLFGATRQPAPMPARAIGSYARGCLAGGRQLAVDGPAWQAMRLSRDRQWGHPELITLVERFAAEVKAQDSWPGLLIGDMSQPRGGPMLTGHASHQIGLDADIWFTPMPSRKLTRVEREEMPAVSMLAEGHLAVDPKAWGEGQMRLIKRAASYPEVERVLVHPAIKKALCEATAADIATPAAGKAWLNKVRPIWGHYYHFHIRIGCPKGASGCVPQAPIKADDGCGKELDGWYKLLKMPRDPNAPSGPDKTPLTLEQLPADCRIVLEAERGTKAGQATAKAR